MAVAIFAGFWLYRIVLAGWWWPTASFFQIVLLVVTLLVFRFMRTRTGAPKSGVPGLLIQIAVIYWIFSLFFPTYGHFPRINDIAWGNDGSLYMKVRWVVNEKKYGLFGEHWENVVSFGNDAVYRLDPSESVVRMVPEDEARLIRKRWNAAPWVGSRYGIRKNSLVDFENGETFPLPAAQLGHRLSPQNDYLVYRDTALPQRVHVMWLPKGPDVTVPESVIPITTWFDRPTQETFVYQHFALHPTIHGLLDREQKLLIDPVTFETRNGWDPYAGEIRRNPLGPNGRDHVGVSGSRVGGPRISFSFPGEYARFSFPGWWKDLSRYPKEYRLAER